MINKSTITEYEKKTKYPLLLFFQRFTAFLETDYKPIIDFYSGKLPQSPVSSFKNFEYLFNEIKNVFNVFENFSGQFRNTQWFLLEEKLEEIHNVLSTINKLPKWLRSSITSSSYSNTTQIVVALRHYQTIESLIDEAGFSNPEDNWIEVAMNNELEEEGYTTESNQSLQLNMTNSFKRINITSIVDSPQDDNILGKDLKKKLTYNTVEQDLEVLKPEDTFKQTVQILALLKKNDNPEFKEYGRNEKLVAGSNVNSIAYPILFKQMNEVFRTDDTIKNFRVTNIDRRADALFVEYEVRSRKNDVQIVSLPR